MRGTTPEVMQAVAVPKPHITPRMSGQVKGDWKYGINYTLGFGRGGEVSQQYERYGRNKENYNIMHYLLSNKCFALCIYCYAF